MTIACNFATHQCNITLITEYHQMNQYACKLNIPSPPPSKSFHFTSIPAEFVSSFCPSLQSMCDHPRCPWCTANKKMMQYLLTAVTLKRQVLVWKEIWLSYSSFYSPLSPTKLPVFPSKKVASSWRLISPGPTCQLRCGIEQLPTLPAINRLRQYLKSQL